MIRRERMMEEEDSMEKVGSVNMIEKIVVREGRTRILESRKTCLFSR